MTTPLHYLSAFELNRCFKEGEITAREICNHFIARIEAEDGPINAVVVRDFERARQDADALDIAKARGKDPGPLAAVPITVKESYDLPGHPTTWGMPWRQDHRAREDAVVVARYRAAGALVLGKTNVPVALSDYQSVNPIYGRTSNPWDLTRSPGGSSGGGSAALAAGFCALEAGSDIGGSLRNPAHYCGIFSHKPSWNIVPTRGHGLSERTPPPDLAVVGPMARTAADLEQALDVLAGPDTLDAVGWSLDLPASPHRNIKDFRIALWSDDENAPISTEYKNRLEALADRLEAEGATVDRTARPDFDAGRQHFLYTRLCMAVFAWTLPEPEIARLESLFGEPDEDSRSGGAQMLLAAKRRHSVWLNDNFERHGIHWLWREFFSDYDLLLCPVAATSAALHDDNPDFETRTRMVNGQEQPFFLQSFWAGLATLGQLPATIAPIGLDTKGLPLGVQIIAGNYQDKTSLHFARQLENLLGGFQHEAITERLTTQNTTVRQTG